MMERRPGAESLRDREAGGLAAPYLQIAGLWKAFGDFVALKDITLDIAPGEFVCFLGPSGCGKTTLLRAIAGLDPQTRGTIRQGGANISRLPPSKRDYGIVFQSYALFPNLTVRRNVAFGLENIGRSRLEIEARVTELLSLVRLPEQGSKYPAQLSGGQQQRIALARAIAIDPGLLLLDEPLSALDAKVRLHLRHEIKELQRKLGITTIMVTHDQGEALSMADRIVVMNHGGIEQVGTPAEIYRAPATLFVADFMGETNKAASTYEAGTVRLGDVALATRAEGIAEGAAVTVAIRPEYILPHGAQAAGSGIANMLSVIIADMEFLGSFWRAHLRSAALDDQPLIASFSMSAVRRLDLRIGTAMQVELPAEQVLVFACEARG